MKDSSGDDVDKFLWNEEGIIWGAYTVILDTSAESLLAYLFQMDTYAEHRAHVKENGTLLRKIETNVNGSRSMHYHVGKKLTALDNRLFNANYCWKKLSDGSGYIFGHVPLKEKKFSKQGSDKESKGGFVQGEATGGEV